MKATQKVSVGESTTGDDEDDDEEEADVDDVEDSDVMKDPTVEDKVEMEEMNLDSILTGNGDDTDDMQKMMEAVLKTVKNAIKSVDDEVQGKGGWGVEILVGEVDKNAIKSVDDEVQGKRGGSRDLGWGSGYGTSGFQDLRLAHIVLINCEETNQSVC